VDKDEDVDDEPPEGIKMNSVFQTLHISQNEKNDQEKTFYHFNIKRFHHRFEVWNVICNFQFSHFLNSGICVILCLKKRT
jgi:hypothetical protein